MDRWIRMRGLLFCTRIHELLEASASYLQDFSRKGLTGSVATSRGTNIDKLLGYTTLLNNQKQSCVRYRGDSLCIEEREPFDFTFVKRSMI